MYTSKHKWFVEHFWKLISAARENKENTVGTVLLQRERETERERERERVSERE